MRCIRPIQAGLDRSGNLTFNRKLYKAQYLELECRKCLPCRLNIAREKAIRAVHEAKMHESNIFLTLTYSDEHMTSDRLQYRDFQNFMKKLRKTTDRKLPYIVTGEYGEKTKRPHWHAIIFNYDVKDPVYRRKTETGDKIYSSNQIDKIWGKNDPLHCPSEIGDVTIDSAGYVCRYAAKKLVHGQDQDHDYHPIHKTSSKYGIGRPWIEKYHKHTFENGFVLLRNGTKCKIPRYYCDWYKKNYPEKFEIYANTIRQSAIDKAIINQRKEDIEYFTQYYDKYHGKNPLPISRPKVKETILKSKFKQLQERLKL